MSIFVALTTSRQWCIPTKSGNEQKQSNNLFHERKLTKYLQPQLFVAFQV